MNIDPREKTILVVDDETNLLKTVRDFLVYKGYRVITAVDGEEALKKAHLTKPHLILLDIMMPKIDGFGVCKMLKKEEAFRQIPIVMLTAKAQPIDVSTGYEVGADIYLVKPVELDILSNTIERFLLNPS